MGTAKGEDVKYKRYNEGSTTPIDATEADWKALEASHAYLGEDFRLLYGGYFTKNTAATAYNGSRFMGTWAYFWTATSDTTKDGEFYFARKKFYGTQQMERLSIEPTAYFLSVRFVR